MIEAPEALLLAEQLNKTIKGKIVTDVIVKHTPHKFAFFYGNPEEDYPNLLINKNVSKARAVGGIIEINLENNLLILSDGVNLRYYEPGVKLPDKHQLLIGFEDQSCLVISIRMYGILLCFRNETQNIPISVYYETAKNKPQVMTDDFSLPYFQHLINNQDMKHKSAKAFLATEQTIPGLGNGVLQDILYNAKIHPKTKIGTLSDRQRTNLFNSIRSTLTDIYQRKGRNTETDLFGINGKYIPFLSKDTVGTICPRCGEIIHKENYLGGSIYYCNGCQG